jgi:hypothetical protein
MNGPLEKLVEEVGKASGRAGKFSARLGDIVERYDLIIRLTPVPELSDVEKMILKEVVCGGNLSPTLIRHMSESVMDCTGNIDERIALRDKIVLLTPAERIAVIEAMDLLHNIVPEKTGGKIYLDNGTTLEL